jgi:uncharacterized protein YggE
MQKWIVALVLLTTSIAGAQSPTDFVQAQGEGEVKIRPDFVTISVQVFSRAATASQAQALNAKEMLRVEKVLKQDFKIDAKDIQTQNFQVVPQYEYQGNRNVFKGMMVNHSLMVKFRKVDQVGGLLDKLISGSNDENLGLRIEDVSFGSDQLRSFETQALEQAVANAKARAQALAKAAQRNLGTARRILDSRVASQPPTPIRLMGKAMYAMDAASSESTNLSAGDISVRAQVQVEFDLK